MDEDNRRACKDSPEQFFYGPVSRGRKNSFHLEAEELCAECPVLQSCMSTVTNYLESGVELEGFWAGRCFTCEKDPTHHERLARARKQRARVR